jgi:hypothetical protein
LLDASHVMTEAWLRTHLHVVVTPLRFEIWVVTRDQVTSQDPHVAVPEESD